MREPMTEQDWQRKVDYWRALAWGRANLLNRWRGQLTQLGLVTEDGELDRAAIVALKEENGAMRKQLGEWAPFMAAHGMIGFTWEAADGARARNDP